jgi:hypothetical protein
VGKDSVSQRYKGYVAAEEKANTYLDLRRGLGVCPHKGEQNFAGNTAMGPGPARQRHAVQQHALEALSKTCMGSPHGRRMGKNHMGAKSIIGSIEAHGQASQGAKCET